jgi:hypothetical protein
MEVNICSAASMITMIKVIGGQILGVVREGKGTTASDEVQQCFDALEKSLERLERLIEFLVIE